jgi:hypothetical protein
VVAVPLNVKNVTGLVDRIEVALERNTAALLTIAAVLASNPQPAFISKEDATEHIKRI